MECGREKKDKGLRIKEEMQRLMDWKNKIDNPWTEDADEVKEWSEVANNFTRERRDCETE